MSPVRPMWFYTYVLMSERNGKFYTGVTENLNKSDAYRREIYLMGRGVSRPVMSPRFYTGKTPRGLIYLKTGRGKRFLKNRLKGGLTG